MKTIIGIQRFKAKDNSGNVYTQLHLMDNEPIKSEVGEGYTVETVFVPSDCEIQGTLALGNNVRVFSEGSGKFYKVTLIIATSSTKQK